MRGYIADLLAQITPHLLSDSGGNSGGGDSARLQEPVSGMSQSDETGMTVRTYLGDGYHLAVSTPSCGIKELWYLGGLSAASHANYNDDGKCFNKVEQTFAMLCNRQKSSWLMKGWDEVPR